jgi:hypothetical protein
MRLTELAGAPQLQLYTANRFLFDQAPQKRLVCWWFGTRPGSSQRSLQPGEPPVLTFKVKKALGINDPADVQKRPANVDKWYKTYCAAVSDIAAKALPGVRSWFEQWRNANVPERLKRIIDQLLEHLKDGGNPASTETAAPLTEYLARLCLYLNATLCFSEQPPYDGVGRILTVQQCAFMARSLYEYYGGEMMACVLQLKKKPKTSCFYSVPVYVPAWRGLREAGRISILGIGTFDRLCEIELREWGRVAEQIVFPAQQHDVLWDPSLTRAEARVAAMMHVGQWSLRSARGHFQEYSRTVEELLESEDHVERHESAKMEVADSLESSLRRFGFLAKAIETLKAQEQGVETEAHLLGLYRRRREKDVPSRIPMRALVFRSICRGLSPGRYELDPGRDFKINDSDEGLKRELERRDPERSWRLDLSAFEGLCAATGDDALAAWAWELLFEEWAAIVRKHRALGDVSPSWASVAVTEDGGGACHCKLSSGPSPQFGYDGDPGQPDHGQTLIRLCVQLLAGPDVEVKFESDSSSSAWTVSFTIPSDRWGALCP